MTSLLLKISKQIAIQNKKPNNIEGGALIREKFFL